MYSASPESIFYQRRACALVSTFRCIKLDHCSKSSYLQWNIRRNENTSKHAHIIFDTRNAIYLFVSSVYHRHEERISQYLHLCPSLLPNTRHFQIQPMLADSNWSTQERWCDLSVLWRINTIKHRIFKLSIFILIFENVVRYFCFTYLKQ